MRQRAAQLCLRPGPRARRGHRPQPRALHGRGHRARPRRARSEHGDAAARAARARGDAGRKPLRDRGARRGPSLRRRQLRRRGRDARLLHGRGPGPRRWRRPAACWSRAAACSTWSTCAAPARARALAGLAGEALGLVAGGCHPNRATDQLLAVAGFWIDSLERDKLPKAPPLVRPLIRGVARRPSGVGVQLGLAAVRLNSRPRLPGQQPVGAGPGRAPVGLDLPFHRGHLLLARIGRPRRP